MINIENVFEQFRTSFLLDLFDKMKEDKFLYPDEIIDYVCNLLNENNIYNLASYNYKIFLNNDLTSLESYFKISDLIENNNLLLVNSFKILVIIINKEGISEPCFLKHSFKDFIATSGILKAIFKDLDVYLEAVTSSKFKENNKDLLYNIEMATINIANNKNCKDINELYQVLIVLMQENMAFGNIMKLSEIYKNADNLNYDEKVFIVSILSIALKNNKFLMINSYFILNFTLLFLFKDPGNCKNLLN